MQIVNSVEVVDGDILINKKGSCRRLRILDEKIKPPPSMKTEEKLWKFMRLIKSPENKPSRLTFFSTGAISLVCMVTLV